MIPEPRYTCPVCLDLPMIKLQLTHNGQVLLLDSCRSCGGMWFDYGEVDRLRQLSRSDLEQKISLAPKLTLTTCHNCHIPMDRNHAVCSHCGHKNQIDCPVCHQGLQRKEVGDRVIDSCRSCQGVWFDASEVLSIWSDQSGILQQPLPGQPLTAQRVPRQSPNKPDKPDKPDNRDSRSPHWATETAVEAALDLATYGAFHPGDTVESVGIVVEQSGEAIAETSEVATTIVEGTSEGIGTVIEGTAEGIGPVIESMSEMGAVLEVTGDVAAAIVELVGAMIGGLFS